MTPRAQRKDKSVVEKFPKFTKNPAEWGAGGDVVRIDGAGEDGMSHKYKLCDVNMACEGQNAADQGDYRGEFVSHKARTAELATQESGAPLCLVNSGARDYTSPAENLRNFTKIQVTPDQRGKGRRVA